MTEALIGREQETQNFTPLYGLQSRMLLATDDLNPERQLDLTEEQITQGLTRAKVQEAVSTVSQLTNAVSADERTAYWQTKVEQTYASQMTAWKAQVVEQIKTSKGEQERFLQKLGYEPGSFNEQSAQAFYDQFFQGESSESQIKGFIDFILDKYTKKVEGKSRIEIENLNKQLTSIQWLAGIFGPDAAEIATNLLAARINVIRQSEQKVFIQKAKEHLPCEKLSEREKALLAKLNAKQVITIHTDDLDEEDIPPVEPPAAEPPAAEPDEIPIIVGQPEEGKLGVAMLDKLKTLEKQRQAAQERLDQLFKEYPGERSDDIYYDPRYQSAVTAKNQADEAYKIFNLDCQATVDKTIVAVFGLSLEEVLVRTTATSNSAGHDSLHELRTSILAHLMDKENEEKLTELRQKYQAFSNLFGKSLSLEDFLKQHNQILQAKLLKESVHSQPLDSVRDIKFVNQSIERLQNSEPLDDEETSQLHQALDDAYDIQTVANMTITPQGRRTLIEKLREKQRG